jgi:hypothetical protein
MVAQGLFQELESDIHPLNEPAKFLGFGEGVAAVGIGSQAYFFSKFFPYSLNAFGVTPRIRPDFRLDASDSLLVVLKAVLGHFLRRSSRNLNGRKNFFPSATAKELVDRDSCDLGGEIMKGQVDA